MSDPSAERATSAMPSAPSGPHHDHDSPASRVCCSDAPPPSRAERTLAALDRLPRMATALVVVALVVVGLLVGGPVGAVVTGIGIVCLAVILALTWPRITVPERALRLAVLVFLIGLTIVRTVPR